MWTSIFVAATKGQAEKICERLEAEGISEIRRQPAQGELRDTRPRLGSGRGARHRLQYGESLSAVCVGCV